MAGRFNISANDLPMQFAVKFLGSCAIEKTQERWGADSIRKAVNLLVESSVPSRDSSASAMEMVIKLTGLEIVPKSGKSVSYQIASINYGAQSKEYNKVFCLITSNTPVGKEEIKYRCHAFVCANKQLARQLTYALSAAFTHMAAMAKSKQEEERLRKTIDLRGSDFDKNKEDEEETEA